MLSFYAEKQREDSKFSALTVKIVVTGGIADAQARREYLQTQGWTLGGPLYRRPQKAAAEGLKALSTPAQTAERRGLTVAEMFVGKEH